MMKKKLKTLLLASTLSLPASAMADWPVAIVDNVTVHAAQTSITIDPLENDIGIDLEIPEVNNWSENGARIRLSPYTLSYDPPRKFFWRGWVLVCNQRRARQNQCCPSQCECPT